MKKILFLLIALAFTIVSAVAQNSRPAPNQRPAPISKNGEWWEPDTVKIFQASYSNQEVYSYNENGLLIRQAFLGQDHAGEWKINSQYIYEYDENMNLISDTYIKRSENDVLENQDRISYTYNGQNKVTSEMLLYWKDGEWTADLDGPFTVDPYLTVYTYNNEGDTVMYTFQERENGEWQNRIRFLFDYEQHSLIKTGQSWKPDSSNWANSQRYLYIFDERGNKLSESNQFWNGNQWHNSNYYHSTLMEYAYDANDNMLMRLYKIWHNNEWVSRSLRQNEYDPSGNLLKCADSEWDVDEWHIYEENVYTYNENNKMLTCTLSYPVSGVMTMAHLTTCEYDESGQNRISTWVKKWFAGNLNSQLLYTDTYDEYGNCTVATAQEWNNNSWEDYNGGLSFSYNNSYSTSQSFYNCHRLEISYTKVNKLSIDEETVMNNIAVYPNPTTGELRVENGESIVENVDFFNIYGQKCHSQNGSILNISHLPAGVYLLKINTDAGVITKKIVKL